MKNIKFIAFAMLAVLILLSLVACGGETVETTESPSPVETRFEAPSTTAPIKPPAHEYSFTLKVVFKDGSEKSCTVATDFETVGEALLDAGLIEGEAGPYGLYVKKVCGEVADYDIDKTYWALYVGGEYSLVGVDALKCADVTEVEFRVEK